MLNKTQVDSLKKQERYITKAKEGEDDLGPLKLLPGVWKNDPGLLGRGWNMIALPFKDGPFKYRLLVNQYNEELKFDIVDVAVPNRGLPTPVDADEDQFIVALDYIQNISQISADDSPNSGLAGDPNLAIHREPGIFLHMANRTTNNLDIARLATIPHGDSVLALGIAEEINGAPTIPDISGLPIGVPADINNPYLAPYKHFNDNLFNGLFDPVIPNELLKAANQGVNIIRTTKLAVDTTVERGGISNIPFIVKEANAAEMKSTFWIQEIDDNGTQKLRLQYSQIVMLDFFPRRDGLPGLIRWPHVSINTLEKVVTP